MPAPGMDGAARRALDQVAIREELIGLVAEDEAEHGFGMVADPPEGDVFVAGQGEGVPRFTLRLPAGLAAAAVHPGGLAGPDHLDDVVVIVHGRLHGRDVRSSRPTCVAWATRRCGERKEYPSPPAGVRQTPGACGAPDTAARDRAVPVAHGEGRDQVERGFLGRGLWRMASRTPSASSV